MEYEVIDNFLEPENFKKLTDSMLDSFFPWYITEDIVGTKNFDQWALTHKFYEDYEIQSGFFKQLSVVLDKLQIKSLIRIKANLYPKTDKIIKHDFHVDFDFSHKSGLYSLNTNNGFTIMEDGEKIESVANRMIIFDASKLHKSTTCTDENFRANIVFNYF
jgi:hypothetical protein|tara:strand:+ start:48 stop:530 length:483 start_codon:yes stop_codon:yes gene_type:complete